MKRTRVLEDHVFLWVSLIKGVKRFRVKGKLAPIFIGLFQILEWVSPA